MPVAASKPVRRLRINRFTVMAMLQAARAKTLGLSEASAYSWGLNRAIFYAAAKRGFRATVDGRPVIASGPQPVEEGPPMYALGTDKAYLSSQEPGPLFTIGGETQTEDEFRRQIAARFGEEAAFQAAWREAMEIVGRFDPDTLGSPRGFYDEVYRPRRDALVLEWGNRFGPPAPVPVGPGSANSNRRARRKPPEST
jgi:hypothetical protein